MSNNEPDISDLFQMLKKAVVIPIPLKEKGPRFKGWNQMTWEKTQTPEYKQQIQEAIERGGNLGIVLGSDSGNLTPIDFDDEADAEQFFKIVPWARDTMITRGCHGCQVWFIQDSWYPEKRVIIKQVADKPTVEFRGGGGLQSVVYGIHPEGMRYTWNRKAPKHIDYVDLQLWLATFKGQKTLEEERPGQNLDHTWLKKYGGSDIRNLDLIELLKAQGVKLRKIDEITWAIPCPWKYNHTSGNGDRDAAIIQHPPGRFFPAFKCFHAHCSELGLPDLLSLLEISPEEVRRYCRPSKQKIQLTSVTYSAEEILTEQIVLPQTLVDGLVYAGSKMLIAAPAKFGKTWAGMEMGLSLASGGVWMGFDTSQIPVLYLNMEMREPFFKIRLRSIIKAKDIKNIDNFHVMNLRGTPGAAALGTDLDPLIEFCQDKEFKLVVIDPMYKILGIRDENNAKDIANLLANVDKLIEATGAAFVGIHHSAKGDPNLRETIDRASGSGVFGRDPDVFMSMIKIKGEEKAVKMDFVVREGPGVEPFAARWKDYQWIRDPSILFGQAKKDMEKQPTQADRIWATLKLYPEGLTYSEWLALSNLGNSSFNKAKLNLGKKIEKRGDKYYSTTL